MVGEGWWGVEKGDWGVQKDGGGCRRTNDIPLNEKN